MTQQKLRAGKNATAIGRDLVLNVGTSSGWLLAAALLGGRMFPHSPTPVAGVPMPATPAAHPVTAILHISPNPGTQLGGGVAAVQLAAPVAMPSQSPPEFSVSSVSVRRSVAPTVSQQVVTQSSGGGAANTTASGNEGLQKNKSFQAV
jgi:hypothetical protein